MPRFAANLSLMYTEHPFMERFGAAARDGFAGVEFLFPYAFDVSAIRAQLEHHQLEQVLFNAPPAGFGRAQAASAWERGERGTAALPGRESEFRAGLLLALQDAKDLRCNRLHVMAGCPPAQTDVELSCATFVANLRWAAEQALAYGVSLLIEPLNARDMPGYFLRRQEQAHGIVAEVGAPNLAVQMDLYHCQIEEGDITRKLQRYLGAAAVGHIQIAGAPDRHEPDVGELNYPHLLGLIDRLGYRGWVGCEYRPRRGVVENATRDGLGWMRASVA
jgi:hydroxypyruvate isomerase